MQSRPLSRESPLENLGHFRRVRGGLAGCHGLGQRDRVAPRSRPGSRSGSPRVTCSPSASMRTIKAASPGSRACSWQLFDVSDPASPQLRTARSSARGGRPRPQPSTTSPSPGSPSGACSASPSRSARWVRRLLCHRARLLRPRGLSGRGRDRLHAPRRRAPRRSGGRPVRRPYAVVGRLDHEREAQRVHGRLRVQRGPRPREGRRSATSSSTRSSRSGCSSVGTGLPHGDATAFTVLATP